MGGRTAARVAAGEAVGGGGGEVVVISDAAEALMLRLAAEVDDEIVAGIVVGWLRRSCRHACEHEPASGRGGGAAPPLSHATTSPRDGGLSGGRRAAVA